MSPILVFVIVVCLLYFIQKYYKIYLVGYKIPGPWAVPLLGNVQLIPKLKPQNLIRTFNENREKHRRSYRIWLGPQLWVFLFSPRETRDALNDPTLIRAETFNQLSVLVGNGLLLSRGKTWEAHRRALTPAFHPNILNTFAPTISAYATELVAVIQRAEEKSIEVTEYIFPCILNVIIDTSMGKKLNTQCDPHCKYTHAFHRVNELLFKRMVNPLLAPDFMFKFTKMHNELHESLDVIHTLMETVIKDRREFLRLHGAEIQSATSNKRLTLLDTLLMTDINGQPLTERQIRDEVNTFVFAGVDTSAASLAFILYALAQFPDEQAKVFSEIETLPDQTDAEMNDINDLEYLDMFIKECMRYYTIIPVTGRITTTDTRIGDINYCAGVNIWVDMYGLAHDRELFENPYEFWPERFSKEQKHKIQPYTYLPFAGGPHICIGRKYALNILKILTVKLLQNFKISLSNPDEKLILMAQMVLKSMNGLNLTFTKRM